MALRPAPPRPGAVLSTQVSGSRYFFLELTDSGRAGVIPAYGGFEQCDPDYLVQRKQFEFCALELVVAGEGTTRLNGTEHALRAGSLFHYDATTRLEIRTDPARPMAKYFLCLTGKRATTRVRAAGLRAGGTVHLAMFPEVQRVWEDLIREGSHHRATAGRICAALVEVLLLKVEELAGVAGRTGAAAEETFLRCKGAIEGQAATLATLGDITRAVGVEASHLCRLFRRYQGLSPYQYLLHRKMALAAEYLMDPNALVKEAAGHVGFADPYHFSRCFKKVHHVAPKEFQRSLKHL
ncbi:HTH-type transcriptional activator Btr [Lacunisphaera limnophila]|uniref:HTH-type transcriptional activator Btr n=1 Tax=Lacunisphaera limnophila TaxID=1838286 RepID=A0A1D8ATQ6_9BACT|nr:AraC family transcriptional regulator [Lacunisphaera limnophila]AOS44278.1 HTH-type transcriptional activator Btr [Lacunisphaera limnophila]